MPVRFGFGLPLGVFEVPLRVEGDVCDSDAVRLLAHIDVSADVADEDCLVHRCHSYLRVIPSKKKSPRMTAPGLKVLRSL